MDRYDEYEWHRQSEGQGVSLQSFVRRVLLGSTAVLVFAFLFGFPVLERHMHIQALETKAPDAWGKHLSALCGISVGREMLYSHVIAAEGEHRKQLLRAMSRVNCLDEMGADVQTEAYFLMHGDDEVRTTGESVTGEDAPVHLGVALDRAVSVLDRSESGSGAAVRAILWLDLGWEHLNRRQHRSFVMPVARHLPHAVAEGLLLRMGPEAVPVLFDHLADSRSQRVAAAGLAVLEPVMTPEQQLEYQVFRETGLPSGDGGVLRAEVPEVLPRHEADAPGRASEPTWLKEGPGAEPEVPGDAPGAEEPAPSSEGRPVEVDVEERPKQDLAPAPPPGGARVNTPGPDAGAVEPPADAGRAALAPAPDVGAASVARPQDAGAVPARDETPPVEPLLRTPAEGPDVGVTPGPSHPEVTPQDAGSEASP